MGKVTPKTAPPARPVRGRGIKAESAVKMPKVAGKPKLTPTQIRDAYPTSQRDATRNRRMRSVPAGQRDAIEETK